MINYIVADLDGLLARLAAAGIPLAGEPETYPYGASPGSSTGGQQGRAVGAPARRAHGLPPASPRPTGPSDGCQLSGTSRATSFR